MRWVKLAEWVKQERAKRSWTQEKLAEVAGLERTEVIALEKGRNKGTTFRVRSALAKAFEVGLNAVGGGGTDQPQEAEMHFRDIPGWVQNVSTAQSIFTAIPREAFVAAGQFRADNPPTVITPSVIGLLATAWWEGATEAQKSAVLSRAVGGAPPSAFPAASKRETGSKISLRARRHVRDGWRSARTEGVTQGTLRSPLTHLVPE